MCTHGKSEGLVDMRYGDKTYDANNLDFGVTVIVLDFTTSRYHFEGLDLTANTITGGAGSTFNLWEIIEIDSLLTEFVLWEGMMNTKATTGENAGQQGFSSSTKWIGFMNDAIGVRVTPGGAPVGQEWMIHFAISAQAPHGQP